MTDDRLRLSLRVVDAPVQPSELFVEDLHARLAAELGLGVQTTAVDSVRAPARPDVRRRGRVGWLAVAALLVLALLGLILGQQGRTPEPPPTGSSSFNATATPSSQPSPLPSSTAPTAPAIAESSPALDNLRSDGLVLYESGAMAGLSRLRVLQPDLSSVELLPDVTDVQFGAAWRPDGERLAYTGLRPGRAKVTSPDLGDGCARERSRSSFRKAATSRPAWRSTSRRTRPMAPGSCSSAPGFQKAAKRSRSSRYATWRQVPSRSSTPPSGHAALRRISIHAGRQMARPLPTESRSTANLASRVTARSTLSTPTVATSGSSVAQSYTPGSRNGRRMERRSCSHQIPSVRC